MRKRERNWPKVDAICSFCKKDFQVITYNLKKGFGKYCSKACSNKGNGFGFKKGHKDYFKHLTENRPTNSAYLKLHKWVKKNLGSPDSCAHCQKTGLTGRKINWANKSREYKWELDDWIRLCISCHRKYDHVVKSN